MADYDHRSRQHHPVGKAGDSLEPSLNGDGLATIEASQPGSAGTSSGFSLEAVSLLVTSGLSGPLLGEPPDLPVEFGSRYRLERELGRGAMATVYLAQDLLHQREVAIKVIRSDLSPILGPDRFLREIRIASTLTHPHILPLLDSGEQDSRLFYVMPVARGQTLRARLDRERQLTLEDAVQIVFGRTAA